MNRARPNLITQRSVVQIHPPQPNLFQLLAYTPAGDLALLAPKLKHFQAAFPQASEFILMRMADDRT